MQFIFDYVRMLSDTASFSLSAGNVVLISTATFIFASIAVAVGLIFLQDRKKLSWLLSLINSFLMTILSAFYITEVIPNKKSSFLWDESDFLGVCNLSAVICIIFGVMNGCDLLFGAFLYPRYLDPLSGYIHHSLYIWLMIFAVTGNAGFTKGSPFSRGFLWNLVEELPTFFLALGQIFPSFRTDLGFGLSFFVLRILYHSYLAYFAVLVVDKYGVVVVSMYFLTLLMHINWFQNWFFKYGLKLVRGGKLKTKGKE